MITSRIGHNGVALTVPLGAAISSGAAFISKIAKGAVVTERYDKALGQIVLFATWSAGQDSCRPRSSSFSQTPCCSTIHGQLARNLHVPEQLLILKAISRVVTQAVVQHVPNLGNRDDASTGDVRIRLMWHTVDDLDIHVVTTGGKRIASICYQGRHSSHG